MDLLQDLQYRELIYQITDLESLGARLREGPITLYVGFDPTADSLHIGNLLQILLLRRFQLAGHNPIAVVGGGTGLIGDPSGKSSERQLNAAETVQEWTTKIRLQVERFLDFESKQNPAQLVNNYSWLGQLEVIPFLRDTGKHFPLGLMLAKDSVKSRLEGGISYTEFSYMILQAYDFLRLYLDFGCEMQAGGSDQWGNITAGIELIRRVAGGAAHGLTLPLVTSSDGAKLGKTETGTIWLDPDRTTPYEFYQYWINVGDADVVRFTKYFTFLSRQEIESLAREVEQNPGRREAQRRLAQEATSLVHGEEAMRRAENISQALFYGKLADLTADELEEGLNNVPSFTLEGTSEVGLVDLLAQAGISPSKRRAREDIASGAITLNDIRVREVDRTLRLADRLAGRYIVIRRGKSNYHLIRWVS
ncbi:MAG: tyrosine--tRNA ligase [Candidatus Promineifilaceae bacterium]